MKSLEELLEENSGYNPEPINLEFYRVAEETNTFLKVIALDGSEEAFYTLTPYTNDLDYIQNLPRIYGVIYKSKYYTQD